MIYKLHGLDGGHLLVLQLSLEEAKHAVEGPQKPLLPLLSSGPGLISTAFLGAAAFAKNERRFGGREGTLLVVLGGRALAGQVDTRWALTAAVVHEGEAALGTGQGAASGLLRGDSRVGRSRLRFGVRVALLLTSFRQQVLGPGVSFSLRLIALPVLIAGRLTCLVFDLDVHTALRVCGLDHDCLSGMSAFEICDLDLFAGA